MMMLIDARPRTLRLKRSELTKAAYLLSVLCLTLSSCDSSSPPATTTLDASLPDASFDMSEPDMSSLDMSEPDMSSLDMSEPDMELEPWAPTSEEDGSFWVRVSLDGSPLPEALIAQGGSARRWRADQEGLAYVSLDLNALEALTLFASHPEARTQHLKVEATQRAPLEVRLMSAERPDNPAYPFSDPGEPSRRASTSQCGHCHLNNNDDWFASPHRSAAKNPKVYDLYMGRASGLSDEVSCLEAGGRWALGQVEGQEEQAWQCYQALSALGSLYERCAEPPCDTRELMRQGEAAQGWGGCADCHAPSINEVEGGGQDLLSARGHAFEYGVSCDLCHHVSELDWSAPAGVGGRLSLWRPNERASVTLGGGGYLPLTFGPSPDVSNPRMGLSPRAHYRDGELCGGCHQHDHSDEHSLSPVDRERWPDGELPNQSTYAEWLTGPVSEVAACNACHMPPLAGLMNAANLERFPDADVGVQGGWPRPHGELRQHSWWGPRQPEGGVLRLSASLSLSLSPLSLSEALSSPLLGSSEGRVRALERAGGRFWRAELSVANVGAGHGLPTGEPMRHLISLLELSCEGEQAEAIGGDVVHDIGGALLRVAWAPLSDLRLPQAQVGDVLRVTRPLDEPIAYEGYGAFGAAMYERNERLPEGARWVGRPFDEGARGLERELAVTEVSVSAVSSEGALSLESSRGEALAELEGAVGDVISLSRPSSPREGYAGASGFSFARVMSDERGQVMVPHFVATDVRRDNRLQPDQRWVSEHLLSAPCDDPLAVGSLIYRAYPRWLAEERGWALNDEVIASVVTRPSQPNALTVEALEPNIDTSPTLNATLTLGAGAREALSAWRATLGDEANAELEGEAPLLSPAPELWCELGEVAALNVSFEPSTGPVSLSQSAWAQAGALDELTPNSPVTLSPQRWGVSAYRVARGEQRWRGALVALPNAWRARTQVYQLSLGRAEARAATRRAQAWPWRLEQGELSERALTPSAGAPSPTEPMTFNLSAPQVLINQSSLPIALDLPQGVWAWGGAQVSASPNSPSPRSPQPSPQRASLLLLAPAQGVVLWSPSDLPTGATLSAFGFSAHGGRSWLPPTTLATLTSAGERVAQRELIERLGEPLDLDDGALLERWSALPELTWAQGRAMSASAQAALNLPPPQRTWVYQGDQRSGRWRVGGLLESPSPARLERGALIEVRNLSAQAHPFSVAGHQHQLIDREGRLSAPRDSSWVPMRGRLMVVWPAEAEGVKAGALTTPEGARGLIITP